MDLLNHRVKHKVFGVGTVVAQSDTVITVEFAAKTCKFQYPGPDAFTKFLQAEDASLQHAIEQEAEELKRIAEERRIVEEEAKRKAEEAARAAEQARLEAAAKKRQSTPCAQKGR